MSEAIPTKQQCLDAEIAGAQAAKQGLHFKSDCPHTYDKFLGMNYREFDDFKRPLMNAWFAGWLRWREKHELPAIAKALGASQGEAG